MSRQRDDWPRGLTWISPVSTKGGAMGFAHCLVAITVGVAGSAVLFAGPATTADPDSPGGSVGGSQLSGPGVDLSVTIPTGWHQVPDQVHPQLLQMVYPD